MPERPRHVDLNTLLEENDQRPIVDFDATPFGEACLRMIDDMPEPQTQASVRRMLERDLVNLYKKHNTRRGFIFFCNEALRGDSPVQTALHNLLRREFPRGGDPISQLAALLLDEDVPPLLLESMMRFHVDCFEERRTQIVSELPGLQSRFVARVQESAAAGRLPVSPERVASRIAGIRRIDIVDPVRATAAGEHEDGRSRILLTAEGDLKRLEKVYTHEMNHLLSGRTIINYGRVEEGYIFAQRVGLSFRRRSISPEGELKRNGQALAWLNEAVTEEITMELLGIQEGGYPDERSSLQELYRKGLSRRLLYEAYFEDYDVHAPEGQRVPAWKAFTKHCGEVFPDGGGIRLLLKIGRVFESYYRVRGQEG